MLKSWIIYLLALIGAYIFFLFYRMWLSWIILIFVMSILPAALIMCLLSSFGFDLHISMPSRLDAGDKASAKVTAGNSPKAFMSFWKIRIAAEDLLTGKRTHISHTDISETSFEVPIDTTHSALLNFYADRIRIYDIFGLFFVSKKVRFKREVCIFPKPQAPDVMPDLTSLNAKALRKSSDPYSEIYDIRDLNEGDLPRNIHWKMSAKKDKLLVKEALEETMGVTNIYLAVEEDRDVLDRNLGMMIYVSRYLLERNISHRICAVFGQGLTKKLEVSSDKDLELAVADILRTRLRSAETSGKGGRR